MPSARRDVAPFLHKVRNFLLGREHTLAVRFQDGIAARTQPPPNLPDGPAHRLYANYYFTRDARRKMTPPIDVTKQTLIPDKAAGKPKKLPTPGKVYQWD